MFLFEWSHHRIWSADSKVRVTLQNSIIFSGSERVNNPFMDIRYGWKCFYDNIRGNVVFKRISDFNGLYMNKSGIVKRSLVLADSDIIDSFVYNTVKILRKIMLRIKANEKNFLNRNVLSFALNAGKPAIMPSPFISDL